MLGSPFFLVGGSAPWLIVAGVNSDVTAGKYFYLTRLAGKNSTSAGFLQFRWLHYRSDNSHNIRFSGALGHYITAQAFFFKCDIYHRSVIFQLFNAELFSLSVHAQGYIVKLHTCNLFKGGNQGHIV